MTSGVLPFGSTGQLSVVNDGLHTRSGGPSYTKFPRGTLTLMYVLGSPLVGSCGVDPSRLWCQYSFLYQQENLVTQDYNNVSLFIDCVEFVSIYRMYFLWVVTNYVHVYVKKWVSIYHSRTTIHAQLKEEWTKTNWKRYSRK